MADDSAAATDAIPSPSQIVQGALPGILARAKVVINPYPFGLSDDSNLRMTSVCSLPGVTVELHYRMLLRDGSVKVGRFQHSPNSNRTTKSDDFPLAGGYVTNLSVFASTGSPKVGQVFVIVQLLNGLGAAATVMGTMLQGYVTTTQGLGWPGSPIESSTDGEPAVRTVGGTLPPIGVELSETVPNGARWELLALTTLFTTSAAVPTRRPRLRYASGADFIGFYPHTLAIGPGAVTFITWGPGLVPSADAAQQTVTVGLPNPMRLLAGQTFSTLTGALDVGDSYQTPIYTVREWLEVP